ncbi:MAG: hypothetical protein LBB90_12310, partial [Tannerella sp.]|nr:hypothetical protein [Tannerella sp.]
MGTPKQSNKISKSCIIANPIYDVVFKRLMENERIAKFFLGTILDEPVISLEVRPQEFTYRKEAPKTEQKVKEKNRQTPHDLVG